MKACDVIVKEREKQLEECKVDLLKGIKDGVKREKALPDTGSQSMFHEWIINCRAGEIDDREASILVVELINQAGVGPVKAKAKKGDKDITLSEKVKAAAWEHREKTHELRKITKELVGRLRSLRYFRVVRDFQKRREEPPEVSCPACGRDKILFNEIAVLSSCGHTGCIDCVTLCAEKEECVYAESGACKSAARVLNIVRADTLGTDDVERDGRGKHFGRKLEEAVNLIKSVMRLTIGNHYPNILF